MSAFSTAAMAERLLVDERPRHDNYDEARAALAVKIGVAPGTLENLQRRRLKRPGEELRQRIGRAFIRLLTSDIARLTNDLENARRSGLDDRDDPICEIEAHLARARSAMEKLK